MIDYQFGQEKRTHPLSDKEVLSCTNEGMSSMFNFYAKFQKRSVTCRKGLGYKREKYTGNKGGSCQWDLS